MALKPMLFKALVNISLIKSIDFLLENKLHFWLIKFVIIFILAILILTISLWHFILDSFFVLASSGFIFLFFLFLFFINLIQT